ncbi:MAG: chorismate synthase, partial [Gemmataceae bacterium]
MSAQQHEAESGARERDPTPSLPGLLGSVRAVDRTDDDGQPGEHGPGIGLTLDIDRRSEGPEHDGCSSERRGCGADPEAAKLMEEAILDIRKQRDSIGGIIQLDITGVPVGLGDPVFA